MSEERIQAAALDLEDILLAEREYLVAGLAREAAALSNEKLAALDAFESAFGNRTPIAVSPQTRQLVRDVIQLSEENGVLLSAVRNGVRSLISRFEGPTPDAFVGSYRQGGGQIAFSHATGQYMKRA